MKPIIFSTPMVQAILDGRKTQTRRIVAPPAYARRIEPHRRSYPARSWWVGEHPGGGYWAIDVPAGPPEGHGPSADSVGFTCPYGKPGDVLWVRETWRYLECDFGLPPTAYIVGYECGIHDRPAKISDPYRGDEAEQWKNPTDRLDHWHGQFERGGPKRRSARFMPRWAARLFLRVEGVRVERLQEISDPDIQTEGITRTQATAAGHWRPAFQALWDDLNGKRAPWKSNPWVWVMTFSRTEEP